MKKTRQQQQQRKSQIKQNCFSHMMHARGIFNLKSFLVAVVFCCCRALLLWTRIKSTFAASWIFRWKFNNLIPSRRVIFGRLHKFNIKHGGAQHQTMLHIQFVCVSEASVCLARFIYYCIKIFRVCYVLCRQSSVTMPARIKHCQHPKKEKFKSYFILLY